VDSGYFDCPEVKVLEDCSSSNIYYVSNPLVVSGNPVSTGTTLLVVVNSEYKCVTYTDSIFGSPSDYLNLVITSYTSGCTSCIAPTPTPTPTPTATPTPTPTATPTPTPTYAPNTQFVFTSCTNNSMIIQYSYPPANITQGNVIKDISGNCFTYVDYYLNYTPPVGFVWSFIEMFTASTTTNYGNCIGCLTPAPTPTEAFRTWRGYGSFSLSCPICELTNGGTSYTFYTSPTVSSLVTGVYIYQDSLLQTPLLVSYLRYLGIIYSVDSGYFDCPEVKVLEDCSSSNIYYVSNPLVVSGNPVSTNSLPTTVTIPSSYDSYPSYGVKFTDSAGCETCSLVSQDKQFQDGDIFEFMDGDNYDFQ